MDTLLLDTVAWDIVLDVSGNIGVASNPYSLAQDAASEIRLFAGELFYDTTQGVPYFAEILGKAPPIPLIKYYLNTAAQNVPEVASAKTYFSSFTGRTLSGQVQITASDGSTAAASF